MTVNKQQTNTDGSICLLTATPSGTSPDDIGMSWSGNYDSAVSAVEIKIPSSGGNAKVWNGSAFVAKPVKMWNGSSWVAKPVKYYNGSTWVTTPY